MSVTPCLLFNDQAEAAVAFYLSVFPNSRVLSTLRAGDSGPFAPGAVVMQVFELDGQRLHALNCGADFAFTEALSLVAACETQAEIDRVWDRLCDGGAPQQCGWLKDRYGVSWQVVPTALDRLMTGDPAAAARVLQAVMGMTKIDLAALERAHAGEPAPA